MALVWIIFTTFITTTYSANIERFATTEAYIPCTDEEFYKCSEGQPEGSIKWIQTEAELNTYCQSFFVSIDCKIDLTERCRYEPLPETLENLTENKIISSIFCNKTSVLRKKFLRNVKCLHELRLNDTMHICYEGIKEETDHDKHCKKIIKALSCRKEKVAKSCGKDASEVEQQFMNPDYILRKFNCM